ncbi:MAG: tetratricopeptide repeat protein [Pseudomonadota bacterium]|nr:tetratricopeptide repeat protein [Pseudomonadota bacterium]
MAQDSFRWEIDPEAIDESIKQLRERLKKLFDQGRYTKVRFSYKGKPLLPDVPLAAIVAAEGLSLALAGPLRFLLVNLGMRSFIEVEFIHEATERVREGQDLFAAGEVDGAEAKYREALTMKPDDTAALYHLGILLRVTGRREEAMEVLGRAAKDADHPDAAKAGEALERMKRGGKTL